jgi:hypothetical protein
MHAKVTAPVKPRERQLTNCMKTGWAPGWATRAPVAQTLQSVLHVGSYCTVHVYRTCLAVYIYMHVQYPIQLVSPLTKEQVSLDNGGGGNWGAVYDGDNHTTCFSIYCTVTHAKKQNKWK